MKSSSQHELPSFIGQTGSGKSQVCPSTLKHLNPFFTNSENSSTRSLTLSLARKGPRRRAGDSLTSVTQDLAAYRILDHERYESRIVLVDTPGFDDTKRTDEQILKLIGHWLKKTCVQLNLSNPSYLDNHVCVDIRNEYYYRGSCMCKKSPNRGCPRHPIGISSCSRNSLVPGLQRTSSSPPRCGTRSAPGFKVERSGSRD
jgi:hypothetical protein